MDIRVPNLGEDADSGTVASVFVKEGEVVEKDQALIELESEKAVASIPSTSAGTVSRVHVRVGDEIRVGTVIVSLDSGPGSPAPEPAAGESAPRSDDDSGPDESQSSLETASKRPSMQRLPKPDSPASPPQELPEGVAPAASPTIRRIARDLGIDLTRIHGTARGGRIVMGDLRDHIARLQSAALSGTSETRPKVSAPAGRQVDFTRWGPVEVKRASSLRKTIASRMVDSWTRIPHVTQFADADITDLMAMRKKYVPAYKAKDARLTLTPIIFKAVAQVLAAHPVVNSSWDEDAPAIVTKKYIHIGLAVDTEAGLLVPVVRDVDQKSVFELAREIEDLSERSRQRKISKDEMQGGTFTVSNQGGIGGAHFTPIINAPEAAILGLGRARELPSQVDGKVRSRLMLPVALAHDHRLVDGADGVRFLVDLIGAIEHFPEAELKL